MVKVSNFMQTMFTLCGTYVTPVKIYIVYENTHMTTHIHTLPPYWLCERLKYVRRRCTPHIAKTEGCSCLIVKE